MQDAYDYDFQTDRPEEAFPLKRTKYEKLYLDASDLSMKAAPVEQEAKTSYESNTLITGLKKIRN